MIHLESLCPTELSVGMEMLDGLHYSVHNYQPLVASEHVEMCLVRLSFTLNQI